MNTIEFRDGFDAAAFLPLAERVWPREYDAELAEKALLKSINIGAASSAHSLSSGIVRRARQTGMHHAKHYE